MSGRILIGFGRGGKYYHVGEAAPPVDPRQHGVPAIRSDKPHVSKSAAIHVDQVKDFNHQCVRGVHYDPATGNLISTSSRSRLRELRRRGMTDSWS